MSLSMKDVDQNTGEDLNEDLTRKLRGEISIENDPNIDPSTVECPRNQKLKKELIFSTPPIKQIRNFIVIVKLFII